MNDIVQLEVEIRVVSGCVSLGTFGIRGAMEL